MSLRFRKRRNADKDIELNITAFLNLMVVLIPFLLLNAVFTQIAIQELNLPNSSSQTNQEDNDLPFILEVHIYSDRFDIIDRKANTVLHRVLKKDGKHDARSLQQALLKLKASFPSISDLTLLCEEETPYDLIIKTMDTIRFYPEIINGQPINKALYPDISIGSTPKNIQKKATPSQNSKGDKA